MGSEGEEWKAESEDFIVTTRFPGNDARRRKILRAIFPRDFRRHFPERAEARSLAFDLKSKIAESISRRDKRATRRS